MCHVSLVLILSILPISSAVQPAKSANNPNNNIQMVAATPTKLQTFDKKISTPDPIPLQGQQRALELMKSGALFRYTPGFLSETAQAEADMCEYTKFKYA